MEGEEVPVLPLKSREGALMGTLKELNKGFLLFSEPTLVSKTKKSKGQMQAGWQLMDRIKEGAGPGSASSPRVPTNNE